MGKQLVQVMQSQYREDAMASAYDRLGALSALMSPIYIVQDILCIALNANIVLSTFQNTSDGSLTYCRTQSHHDMCNKVPDMKFIGVGKWVWKSVR